MESPVVIIRVSFVNIPYIIPVLSLFYNDLENIY